MALRSYWPKDKALRGEWSAEPLNGRGDRRIDDYERTQL